MRYAKPSKKRSKKTEQMSTDDGSSFVTTAELDRIAVGALRRNGAHPAFIFAYERVGFLVSEQNWKKWSPEDLAAWETALSEYELQHPDQPSLPPPRRIRLVDIGLASN